MSADTPSRLTFNLEQDSFGRPIFLMCFGDRWKLRSTCRQTGVLSQIELTVEQIRMIAQVAKV